MKEITVEKVVEILNAKLVISEMNTANKIFKVLKDIEANTLGH